MKANWEMLDSKHLSQTCSAVDSKFHPMFGEAYSCERSQFAFTFITSFKSALSLHLNKRVVDPVLSWTSAIPKVSVRATFPGPEEPGQLVEIPTYHPSTELFHDPISYIGSIQSDAEPYGMCRIQPPEEWKVRACFSSRRLLFSQGLWTWI